MKTLSRPDPGISKLEALRRPTEARNDAQVEIEMLAAENACLSKISRGKRIGYAIIVTGNIFKTKENTKEES